MNKEQKIYYKDEKMYLIIIIKNLKNNKYQIINIIKKLQIRKIF